MVFARVFQDVYCIGSAVGVSEGRRSLSDACMAIGSEGMQYQSTTAVAGRKP